LIGNNPQLLVAGEVLILVPGTSHRRNFNAPGPQEVRMAPLLIDSGAASRIKHVFVIVQENHTFDNYFGTSRGLMAFRLGSACRSIRESRAHQSSALHLQSSERRILTTAWITARAAFNNGRMDGFVAAQQDRNLPDLCHSVTTTAAISPITGISPRTTCSPTASSRRRWAAAWPTTSFLVAGKSSGTGESIPAQGIPMTTIFDRLQVAGLSWKFYVKNYDPPSTSVIQTPRNPRDSEIAWVPLLTIPAVVDDPAKMARIQDLANLYRT